MSEDSGLWLLAAGPAGAAALYWALYRRLGAQVVYRMALINGEPGLVRYLDGRNDRREMRNRGLTADQRGMARLAMVRPDAEQTWVMDTQIEGRHRVRRRRRTGRKAKGQQARRQGAPALHASSTR